MSLNGFRHRVTHFLLGKSREGKPVVMSQYGQTTESARLAAALNMKQDHEVRARVEAHFIHKNGGNVARGLMECRKQFPEAYLD